MGNGNTILLIDNDRDFTSIVRRFLRNTAGFEVDVRPDGYNGIIYAKKNRPALILLDIRMPAMNGLDILGKLKSDPDTAAIPVIVLTAFDSDEIKKRSLALNAAGYLAKPFDLELLSEKVHELIK
jgi:DNA-binding response OmpR family regulator